MIKRFKTTHELAKYLLSKEDASVLIGLLENPHNIDDEVLERYKGIMYQCH